MTAAIANYTDQRTRAALSHSLTAEVENPYDPASAEEPQGDSDEPSELEDGDGATIDDANWDVFVADDDEFDPLPDPGDFWMGD